MPTLPDGQPHVRTAEEIRRALRDRPRDAAVETAVEALGRLARSQDPADRLKMIELGLMVSSAIEDFVDAWVDITVGGLHCFSCGTPLTAVDRVSLKTCAACANRLGV